MGNFDISLNELQLLFKNTSEIEIIKYIKDDNKKFNLCYVLINNINIVDITNKFNIFCENGNYIKNILTDHKLLNEIEDKKMQELFYNIINSHNEIIFIKLIVSYALYMG